MDAHFFAGGSCAAAVGFWLRAEAGLALLTAFSLLPALLRAGSAAWAETQAPGPLEGCSSLFAADADSPEHNAQNACKEPCMLLHV